MRLSAENYYVVICSDEKYAPKDVANRIIAGVFSTKAEAKICMNGIQGCVLPHTIKKCKVSVEYEGK